ncbi:DegV family protein [Lutispora thermophila]|uniref:EDD domain protein, DegV family n=1 Tax=Lutispora thermophila DSM 19022 TaxID=1122184 RepID=A0A1M6HAC1_9FIRM|nr:DegV family protein [Lutispora thermophila]SHJ19145.1 EDD domain protein, DegV family [Lutispora thermophila DSM 19022]
MAITILTDTMCDVPQEYVERYNIRVLPLLVNFGEESFRDGIDITPDDFFRRLENSEQLPTTSQINPPQFECVFREEIGNNNTVIAILGSSKLSGTFNSAMIAKDMVDSDNIHIIDSKAVTLGAGLLVIKAAKLAQEGRTAEEIVSEIEEATNRLKQFFIIGNLKYLYKGGRISLSASVLGSILNIKPIVTTVDGKLEMQEKTRGMKRAISVIMDMIEEKGWTLNDKVIGINHSICAEDAYYFEEVINAKYKPKEIIRGGVGSVVGTHAGPGCVALHFES